MIKLCVYGLSIPGTALEVTGNVCALYRDMIEVFIALHGAEEKKVRLTV
jgi:hypothetical protein